MYLSESLGANGRSYADCQIGFGKTFFRVGQPDVSEDIVTPPSKKRLRMKPGGSGDAHCKRALLQNPIAFFLYESERIPWVRRVAHLGPDYTCLANEFRPSTNQIHLDHGILLQ
jgi:hypothetical protein